MISETQKPAFLELPGMQVHVIDSALSRILFRSAGGHIHVGERAWLHYLRRVMTKHLVRWRPQNLTQECNQRSRLCILWCIVIQKAYRQIGRIDCLHETDGALASQFVNEYNMLKQLHCYAHCLAIWAIAFPVEKHSGGTRKHFRRKNGSAFFGGKYKVTFRRKIKSRLLQSRCKVIFLAGNVPAENWKLHFRIRMQSRYP